MRQWAPSRSPAEAAASRKPRPSSLRLAELDGFVAERLGKTQAGKTHRKTCSWLVLALALALQFALININIRPLEALQSDDTTTASTTTTTTTISHEDTSTSTLSSTSSSITTTTTTTSDQDDFPDTSDQDQDQEDGGSSRYDDYVASDCEAISASPSASGKKPTSLERLVRLQGCLRTKMKLRVEALRRSGIDTMDQLSLSGGCTASLMNLLANLAEAKGFAFKFIDSSFKMPSGLMHGVLSDLGHFDECMSIRANPNVEPENEQEEGTYSGQYCLATIRLNYHIELAPNSSVPNGIAQDGVLWDELMRQYWLTKSPKAFQVGFCVPSRCNEDDLGQLYKLVADRFNFVGGVTSCQSQVQLKRQHEPDFVQRILLTLLYLLVALCFVATLLDSNRKPTGSHMIALGCGQIGSKRHQPPGQPLMTKFAPVKLSVDTGDCDISDYNQDMSMPMRLLDCFSLRRNWRLFVSLGPKHSELLLAPSEWSQPAGSNSNNNHTNTCSIQTSASSATSDCSDENDNDNEEDEQLTCDSPETSSSNRRQDSTASNSTRNGKSSGKSSLNIEQSGQSSMAKTTTANRQVISKSIGAALGLRMDAVVAQSDEQTGSGNTTRNTRLDHLVGLRLLILLWLTFGHSFLYPSNTNYQHYRSLIRMNITRDTIWFGATNYTLGVDMLLYISGLLLVVKFYSLANRCSTSGSTKRRLARLLARRLARFWPAYVTMIGVAIVLPLLSDGPMWPELVNFRLGANCRASWWLNLLMVNNFQPESKICLPSSWLVSVMTQTLLAGCVIIAVARRHSTLHAVVSVAILMGVSVAYSFAFAYYWQLPAPVIRIDESSVLTVDERVYSLYTDTLSNLGPFLVGLLGGFALIDHHNSHLKANRSSTGPIVRVWPLALVATSLVVGASFLQVGDYSRWLSAAYWATHRVAWAFSTGYLVHQCATGKWTPIRRLLSLPRALEPLLRLQFIAYLVFPIFIHVHSGQVRDGMSLSLYTTFNVYISRLVMTLASSLILHLLVELPIQRLTEALDIKRRRSTATSSSSGASTCEVAQQQHQHATALDTKQCSVASNLCGLTTPSEPLLSVVVVAADRDGQSTSTIATTALDTSDDDEYLEAVEAIVVDSGQSTSNDSSSNSNSNQDKGNHNHNYKDMDKQVRPNETND